MVTVNRAGFFRILLDGRKPEARAVKTRIVRLPGARLVGTFDLEYVRTFVLEYRRPARTSSRRSGALRASESSFCWVRREMPEDSAREG